MHTIPLSENRLGIENNVSVPSDTVPFKLIRLWRNNLLSTVLLIYAFDQIITINGIQCACVNLKNSDFNNS